MSAPRVPSASTIASLIDDGKSRSFAWAASLITSTTAVHQPEAWAHLGTDGCTGDKDGLCPACTFLRSEFDRRWTAKADLGTHAHHLALSWAQGDEIDVEAEMDPYMDSLSAFYEAHQPEWLETERTVSYSSPASHAYVGQFDAIAVLDCPACKPGSRCKWMVDYKGGGFYPAEQTLQLAAYRCAQHLTRWEPTGKIFRCSSKRWAPCEVTTPHEHCGYCGAAEQHRPYARPSHYTEVIDRPMTPVAHTGVVLLDPEYGGRLVELPGNGDAHGTFLRLRDAWGWSGQMARWEREHADLLPAPRKAKKVAA